MIKFSQFVTSAFGWGRSVGQKSIKESKV